MLIDPAAKTVAFRQSWLDTAIRCPERGRLDAFYPIREEGDAAMAGTAMHAAVEQYLRGNLDIELMEQYAQSVAAAAARDGVLQDDGSMLPVSYKSFDGPNEMIYHAGNCTRGWIQDILPVLQSRGEFVGTAEAKFSFDAFHHRDWLVSFQGTCDWVPDFGNRMWDWKSSGQDYKQKEKQMFAVQPTVYTAAAVAGCFGREFNWPIEFAYGVAIRLKTKARGQLVVCQRNQEHINWLYHRVSTFLDLYLDLGPDRPWPTDEEHYLCSAKWCPWWSQCRGKHISRESDLFGYQPA